MFTIFSANTVGKAANCLYPKKCRITNENDLQMAVQHDYVCAAYKNSYRSNENFRGSNCLPVDCDNDHSDDPADWVTPCDVMQAFPGVTFAVHYSRNNNKEKNGKAARPKFHILFPINPINNPDDYTALKEQVLDIFPYFDRKALDAARFFFGTENAEVEFFEGEMNLTEYLNTDLFAALDNRTISEGSRNSTMSHFAGKILKRFGNTEEARNAFREKADRCSPPLPEEELQIIWHSALRFFEKISKMPGYIAPEAYNNTEIKWEAPIPFEEYSPSPFPIDALPQSVGDYVKAVSESVQAPIDMAACSALAVMSLSLQGKYYVQVKDDWSEPLNLYLLIIAEPSERKSSVISKLMKPVNEYEREYNKQLAPKIESSKMAKSILERRKKQLEEKIVKGTAEESEMEAFAMQYASFKEVSPLNLYSDDITTEKLVSVLSKNKGRAAIVSAEGGIFDMLAGIYSKNVNIDVFLKGYSGDTIKVERIGREAECIRKPALSVFLTVQKKVLSGLMTNGTFRGRGLTARFLYCMPASLVGHRKFCTEAVPPELSRAYEGTILNMLEDSANEEYITLSEEAKTLLAEYSEAVEQELLHNYTEIVDWAGKLIGSCLRIAGILCRADNPRHEGFLEKSEPLAVTVDQMQRAITLSRYFTEHSLASFSLMGVDMNSSEGKKVLRVLKENSIREFTRRDLMRQCRTLKSAEDAQSVIDYLAELGYVAIRDNRDNVTKGRPRTPVYEVNPCVFAEN